MPKLTADEVRAFISDYPECNHLLDGPEFSNAKMDFAIELAIDSYNGMPPGTQFNIETFPSKSVLMYGTLYHLFQAASALLARNHLEYQDGGITVPVEERYQLYAALAANFNSIFLSEAQRLKISMNIEAGWGEMSSDMAYMPAW